VTKPTAIDDEDYVDGGLIDNTPTTHFSDKNGKSLIFTFEEGNVKSTQNIIHSEKKQSLNYPVNDFISKATVNANISFSDGKKKYAAELKKHALSVIPLRTEDVGTLSFKESAEQLEYLTLKGYFVTKEYLINHSHIENEYALQYKIFFLEVYKICWQKNKSLNLEGYNEKMLPLLEVIEHCDIYRIVECFVNNGLGEQLLISVNKNTSLSAEVLKEISETIAGFEVEIFIKETLIQSNYISYSKNKESEVSDSDSTDDESDEDSDRGVENFENESDNDWEIVEDDLSDDESDSDIEIVEDDFFDCIEIVEDEFMDCIEIVEDEFMDCIEEYDDEFVDCIG
jgi:hypothetical protein